MGNIEIFKRIIIQLTILIYVELAKIKNLKNKLKWEEMINQNLIKDFMRIIKLNNMKIQDKMIIILESKIEKLYQNNRVTGPDNMIKDNRTII